MTPRPRRRAEVMRELDVAVSTANVAERRQPSCEGGLNEGAGYHDHDRRMGRRSILIGAAASLICAPAIVRATSLMPVRRFKLPTEKQIYVGSPYACFVERLFYHSLENSLRTGRMCTVHNGKIVCEVDARRLVAHARARMERPDPSISGHRLCAFQATT